MSATQISAAKIVIAKSIPDMKAIEHSGPDGQPLQIGIVQFGDLTPPQSK